jgi:hypothetical protein
LSNSDGDLTKAILGYYLDVLKFGRPFKSIPSRRSCSSSKVKVSFFFMPSADLVAIVGGNEFGAFGSRF